VRTTRRELILSALAAALLPRVPAAGAASGFFERVVQAKAAALAQQPAAREEPLPKALRDLDYDHFRMINFRPERAFWADHGLFRLQLFHRGFQYDRRVTINLVENGAVSEIGYSPDLFDFRANTFKADFDRALGFSGFRLHFPLNRPDYFDETAVFQGGSYFRLLGQGQRFGASARGLAIDTADPHGEEFPAFVEFWLERPAAEAASIAVYALLDSKSTTGAYRFLLAPRTRTAARIEAVLYPRADIKKLGLAPLTSMYLHGKAGSRAFADARPEVHDSDGLMLHTGHDEQLWRPLVNPRALAVSAFADAMPKGFGLVQRERQFQSYQDLEAAYERRPGLWVEPEGDWGEGAVELVEIPTDTEANDNISAYWVPKRQVGAGKPFAFAYRIVIPADAPPLPARWRCAATRSGPLQPVEAAKDDRKAPRRFWIDFVRGERRSPSGTPEAEVTASAGKIGDVQCQALGPRSWRAVFTFTPEGGKDADLRAVLAVDGQPVSETWTYRWAAA
jgi:periplasmic glucans biosynthesis protein